MFAGVNAFVFHIEKLPQFIPEISFLYYLDILCNQLSFALKTVDSITVNRTVVVHAKSPSYFRYSNGQGMADVCRSITCLIKDFQNIN